MTEDPTTLNPSPSTRLWPWVVVVASACLGLALIVDQAIDQSATYDEVTYLKIGARWWRTGEQEEISRLGAPLTCWKLQQAPTLWLIDRFGDGRWIDDPVAHQAKLLPVIRIGGSWIWLASLAIVAAWARSWHGPRAMAMAAALFALSPNLLAHGALSTMEVPLVAASSAMVFAFGHFLRTGSRAAFWGTAALGGLAFSCKFTTVLIPPILAAIWAVDLWLRRDRTISVWTQAVRVVRAVALGMVGFAAIMLLTNVVVTGFAVMPISPRTGAHPALDRRLGPMLASLASSVLESSFPQDWVGFSIQARFQRDGGPSYLFGERRSSGWWYYYPVTLAVKVPLAFWILAMTRVWVRTRDRSTEGSRLDRRDWIIPLYLGLFLLAAVVGSKRNYGVRYLLPLAPAAIVWASALAVSGRWPRRVGVVGVLGMAVAVASIHPHELSYFNVVAGGPEEGRRILSDSNLDWGQGAKSVARLQRDHPEFRDLTWYYFGDTDPVHYGVVGRRYGFNADRTFNDPPPALSASTAYLAVSASLQWGPWGPEGYFRDLDRLTPICYSSDKTVAIYRTSDLAPRTAVRTGRGPG